VRLQNLNVPLYMKPLHLFIFIILISASGHIYAQPPKQIAVPDSNYKKKSSILTIESFDNPAYKNLTVKSHVKSAPTLQDSDGDGIPDQLDLESNTPKGAEVDTHGRAVDTDGDGIPDYKDKEKLTQQKCFPVDSSGVGICQEPDCCRGYSDPLMPAPVTVCLLDSLPGIKFNTGSATLTKKARAILDSIAQLLLANPHCHVIVRSLYGAFSYKTQQLSWDRTFTVTKYLIDTKGILSTHIIFSYENEGKDKDMIIFEPTTNTGPNIIPAPHPQYSKLKDPKGDW